MPLTALEQAGASSVPMAASKPPQTSSRHAFALGLLLVLLSLTLYNPVGRHPFINYDDDRYISDNAHVRDGFSWGSVKWAFTSYDESNWHPVTWLSHMLDCQLFHLNPAGHHYTNAALHALNVGLLFWVLYSATGFVWRSFMAAALFALHPINVESVAWVAERKNLLSLFFFLLALGAYRWYASKPHVGRYGVVAVLFALGLMAKPQVVTLPFVLLLWDYWPLQRAGHLGNGYGVLQEHSLARKSWAWLVLEKVPLFALCVASSILTLKAQTAAGAVTSFSRYPFSIRLENAVVAYARYLGKALWPSHLCLLYPYQPTSLTESQIALSALLLLFITAAVGTAKRPYLTVGWLWFLGTMVPMIGLIQVGVQAIADRYAYLPFIGLFLAACWGAAEFARNRQASAKWLATAVSAVLLTVLALASHRQIGYWGSNLALWSHTAALTNNNFVAEDGIGNALLDQGDLEHAMPHFRVAAEIHPTDPISNSNLAFYKMQHGDRSGAIAQYKKVIEVTHDDRSKANAFVNMGVMEDQLQNFNAARDDFQTAINLRPHNIRAWVGLGVATQKSGDYDAAVRAYSNAVSIQPCDLTYLLLAGALQQSGRREAATAATQTAKQASENFSQTQQLVNNMLAH